MPKAKPAKPSTNADAVSLLKADHRAVEELFQELEQAKGRARKKLADRICTELLIHSAIEEEIFYPTLRGKVEAELLDEGQVEHDGAKVLIAEILEGAPSEPFFDAKLKVLSEMIKHHVKEEEQRGGLFAQAKSADVDLVALGQQMADRKEALAQASAKSGPPRPTARSLSGAKLDYRSADIA